MSVSGWPSIVRVTLGSKWTGKNGMSEDGVIALTEIGSTGEYSENGTDTPNPSSNRVKLIPTGGALTNSIYILGVTTSTSYTSLPTPTTVTNTSWFTAARVTGGTPTDYAFLEIFNDAAASVVSFSTAFLSAGTTDYDVHIFKTMEDGSVKNIEGEAHGVAAPNASMSMRKFTEGESHGVGQPEGEPSVAETIIVNAEGESHGRAWGSITTTSKRKFSEGEAHGVGETSATVLLMKNTAGESRGVGHNDSQGRVVRWAAGEAHGVASAAALMMRRVYTAGESHGVGDTSAGAEWRVTWKHADFEPPSFGEFVNGVQGTHTGVTITQDAAATFPDRPAGLTGVGMKVLSAVALSSGNKYVELSAPDDQQSWNCGGMFNFEGHTTSTYITFLWSKSKYYAGGGGVVRWQGSTRTLLFIMGGENVSVVLPDAFDWNHIEVRADEATLSAWLYVNGLLVGTLTGMIVGEAIAGEWRIGDISPGATVGYYYADELQVGSQYIGPVIVEPEVATPDDPARWLVIYNTDVADSLTWAEGYRVARSIPHANLVGLPLGASETISLAAYQSNIRDVLASYLSRHIGLSVNVVGLLLGYRVPGVTTGGQSIQSLLRDLSDDAEAANPDYVDGLIDVGGLPVRAGLLGTRYLVGELNAPTLSAAQALTTSIDALSVEDALGVPISTLDPEIDEFGGAAASWVDGDAFDDSGMSEILMVPARDGFDGSTHGAAVEVVDDTGVEFGIVGQSRAVLVTSGAAMANKVY